MGTTLSTISQEFPTNLALKRDTNLFKSPFFIFTESHNTINHAPARLHSRSVLMHWKTNSKSR